MFDVITVGAGLAGLAAAAAAAQAGARVLVLEAAAAHGGRARTTTVGGHRFNLGPHALYTKGAGLAVLDALGVVAPGASPPVSGGLAVRGGALHALPTTPAALWSTTLLTLSERVEVARRLVGLAAARDDVALDAWLGGASPVVRDLLGALARLTTYGHAPAVISAGLVGRQLRGAAAGVRYLDGGWGSLVDALAARAIGLGAELRTGARVTGVHPDGDGVIVSLADGTDLPARRVVVSGPVDRVARVLPDSAALAALAGAAVPARVASLDLGLERLPVPETPFALGLDQPTYLSVHSVAKDLAPAGAATLHAAWYREPGDEADHTADLEALMDRVQPGWRERVVARRDVRSAVATSALHLAGVARPDVYAAGLPGVFVAGDWVGHAALADASLASGAAAGASAARCRRAA